MLTKELSKIHCFPYFPFMYTKVLLFNFFVLDRNLSSNVRPIKRVFIVSRTFHYCTAMSYFTPCQRKLQIQNKTINIETKFHLPQSKRILVRYTSEKKKVWERFRVWYLSVSSQPPGQTNCISSAKSGKSHVVVTQTTQLSDKSMSRNPRIP